MEIITLKKKRLDNGWSQFRLAAESGIHPSDISRFESGRLIPYDGQLQKLAKALDVPPAKASTLLVKKSY